MKTLKNTFERRRVKKYEFITKKKKTKKGKPY